MPEAQHRQVLEQAQAQARARADAEHRVSGLMSGVSKAQGEVVGLAGIGLGGNVDVHKIAAAKAMQMGNNNISSPSPKTPMYGGPSPVNGTPIPLPVQNHHGQIQGNQQGQISNPSPVSATGYKPSQA